MSDEAELRMMPSHMLFSIRMTSILWKKRSGTKLSSL